MSELSNLELLAPNNILLCSPLIKLTKSVGSLGHPLLEAVPTSFGQLSSLSGTPSPSESVHGHPPFAASPTTSGQRSMLSATPSPSLSGQPFISADPASLGQASSESATPSPSLSGHP